MGIIWIVLIAILFCLTLMTYTGRHIFGSIIRLLWNLLGKVIIGVIVFIISLAIVYWVVMKYLI